MIPRINSATSISINVNPPAGRAEWARLHAHCGDVGPVSATGVRASALPGRVSGAPVVPGAPGVVPVGFVGVTFGYSGAVGAGVRRRTVLPTVQSAFDAPGVPSAEPRKPVDSASGLPLVLASPT